MFKPLPPAIYSYYLIPVNRNKSSDQLLPEQPGNDSWSLFEKLHSMDRERKKNPTHCFESMAWFPLHFHQKQFSKLFYYFASFRNKVTSLNKLCLISAGYAAWSIQLSLLSTSPGLFSFAWNYIWTAHVSPSSGRPAHIREDHGFPVPAAPETA